ncbi:MAG: FeoB-associated Cys-rich membrane protein [Clostridia bacterium]|nr:FeoB-associated Cys-rich membrane protein [Clostridia bacterium]
MTDIILIVVLILILSASAVYIIKAKKRGEKCIGCPYAKECTKKNCSK